MQTALQDVLQYNGSVVTLTHEHTFLVIFFENETHSLAVSGYKCEKLSPEEVSQHESRTTVIFELENESLILEFSTLECRERGFYGSNTRTQLQLNITQRAKIISGLAETLGLLHLFVRNG